MPRRKLPPLLLGLGPMGEAPFIIKANVTAGHSHRLTSGGEAVQRLVQVV